jgi:hypothetical protein
MEDYDTRRKIIREWMALPKDKRQTEEQAAVFAKKAHSKTSSIAVGAIQIINFVAIRTRKFWAGSCLAPESRDAGRVIVLHRAGIQPTSCRDCPSGAPESQSPGKASRPPPLRRRGAYRGPPDRLGPDRLTAATTMRHIPTPPPPIR